jgi:hypothetical protein
MVSFTLWPFSAGGMSPRYLFDRRFGGSQSSLDDFEMRKISLTLSRINPDSSVIRPSAIVFLIYVTKSGTNFVSVFDFYYIYRSWDHKYVSVE